MIHLLVIADVDGGLGEHHLAHDLEYEPGHLTGHIQTVLVDTADCYVREQGTRSRALVSLDGYRTLVLTGLKPQCTMHLSGKLAGDLAGREIFDVVGIENRIECAHRNGRTLRTLFVHAHMQKTEGLNGFPEVSRLIAGDMGADVGYFEELGLAGGVLADSGLFGGKFGVTLRIVDGGLALNDTGLQDPKLSPCPCVWIAGLYMSAFVPDLVDLGFTEVNNLVKAGVYEQRGRADVAAA